MPQPVVVVTVILAALVMTGVLTLSARRVLGARTSLPRTVVASVVAVGSLWPLGLLFADRFGILDDDGSLVSAPGPLFVTALLMVLWLHVAAVLMLVVMEALAPTASVPSLTQLVRGSYHRARRARRLAQLTRIMSSSGLSHVLRTGPRHQEFSESLVTAINRAGVTYVKLGQMLSTRHDLLPENLTTALSRLQTHAAPLSDEVVTEVVRSELGAEPESLFRSFSHTPLAAASVAQVHEAVTQEGQHVVVKVQRPEARRQVRDDIEVLHQAALIAEDRFDWARNMSVTSIIDELMESVRQELDYRQELSNTRAVEAALSGVRNIVTPTPVPELSTSRVLVVTKLDGVPLTSARERVEALSAEHRARLAENLVDVLIEGIFIKGVFHSDLHPGNIMLLEDGRLGLLDFGSIGVLDSEARQVLATLIYAIVHDDAVTATNAFILAFDVPDEVDQAQLQRAIGREIALVQGTAELDAGLFARLFELARDFGVGIPLGVTAAFRSLGAVESSLQLLNPDMSLLEAARSRMHSMMRRLNSPGRLAAQALGSSAVATAVARRLPMRVEEVSSALAQGRLTIDARPFGHDSDRHWLRSLVDDAISTAVAVASLITAAILLTAGQGEPVVGALSLYDVTGAVFAFSGVVLALRPILRVYQRTIRP
ncbi:ABC1 kinase family protein [Nesterenkonia flava]|uniref:AarF/UbiB family protein n=1 Tax=Nesterenkonia flava TaxID=469799 RepID=A0ABU1FVC1_9MICC|nr:AarF/UbiB family protein [Nesterenkonia flava]MDR5712106.1 AarF/UbiB family protein [Nesterenkonia flava]